MGGGLARVRRSEGRGRRCAPGVQALTGIDDLGLLPGHPPRIHFTYLDPGHLGAGGRVHDSATTGDSFRPAYQPEIVVFSENKDTAIHFPPLAGGISVEGVGKDGKTPASFPWIRDAPVLVYWGRQGPRRVRDP